MKKVLFMSLAMAVAMTGFAQRANVSNAARNASVTKQRPSELRQVGGAAVQGIQFSMPQNMVNASRSLEDFDEYTAMTTNYDLQSNSALGNRIAVWPDGSAAFTATWDHSGNTGFPDRGTGYNFYSPDTKGMGDEPEVRQEPMKSGWPSIAACGEGEVLCSHATGVNLYYRPTRGQGEWELINNWGTDYGSPTWPRVVVSGPNNEYVHIVMAKQISVGDGYDNHIYYVRVKHVGDEWEIPTELNDFPGIDNNGVVHAAFPLVRWRVTDDSHYTMWPAYSFGIVYWNSEYVNEEGGHEILPYGRWSQDTQFPAYYADRGFAYTLINERIDAMAEVDGHQHLHYFGVVDENFNNELDYDVSANINNSDWSYRSIGLSTMPAISVDNLGDIAIAFSTWSELRVNGVNSCNFRGIYVTLKDCDGTWYSDEYGINLAEDFSHELEEQYPCVAATNGYNGQFWIMYSGDENQGLYLDISDSHPNSNGGVLTENYQYACLIRPESLSINEQEAINPVNSTRLYPNPTTDVLNIEVNASQASEMSINVYNIMGQMVMSQNTNISTGVNTRSISTSELSSGIYFLTVKANGFENTMKFIVK